MWTDPLRRELATGFGNTSGEVSPTRTATEQGEAERRKVEDLSYKVRIAALWLLFLVAFFAYRTLALEEGATEVSLLGDDFATYLLVGMGFAFLSLILPSRLNRLANIIAGAVFTVGQVAMLADGLVGYPSARFNLMTGATVVIMASVVWLAAAWPKTATVPSKAGMEAHEAQNEDQRVHVS